MAKITKKVTKTTSRKSKKSQASQLEVLKEAREYLAKKCPGQIIRMDEVDDTVPGYVSTQSLALDWMIGNGGVPQSRIVEVSGDEGTGKSTFGDHLMAEVQRLGGHAYLWDTENARSTSYQKELGVIRDRALLIDSKTMEDGFDTMIQILDFHLARDPERLGIIVWDTPAETPTKKELASLDDPKVKAEQFGPAKLIRGKLRTLNQTLRETRWILVIINQTYSGRTASGNSFKAVYGGKGIPYLASTRLTFGYPSKEFRPGDKALKKPPVGQTIWAECFKNKVDFPFRSKKLFIEFGKGINNAYEIFEVLTGCGAISLNGSWYQFDESFPELRELAPNPFQGGFWRLQELIKDTPGLWDQLLKVYWEFQNG